MGFAITACVLCGIMFICYCVALGKLASAMECHRRNSHRIYTYQDYCGVSYRKAQAGIGLGSVLLIISLMEFFVALTSSIYCCNAVCCGQRTVTVRGLFHCQPETDIFFKKKNYLILNNSVLHLI